MKKLLLFDLESIFKQTIQIDFEIELTNKADHWMINRFLQSKAYKRNSHFANEMKLSNHWYFKHRGEDILEQVYDACSDAYHKLELLDGLQSFLSYAKSKGCKIALCSEGSIQSLEYIVDKFDMDKYLDYMMCKAQCVGHVPDSYMYQTLLMMSEVEKDDCLIFQKSLEGMNICSDMNVDYIRVYDTNYLGDSSILEKGASALVKDFNDPILKEMVNS